MARPKGGYKLKSGKKATGVTTVTGRYDEKGGLLYWAFEQGKAAERGEINKLYDKRDEAADAGTLAHDLVEAKILGKSTEEVIDETNASDIAVGQALNAYRAYLQWARLSKLVIFETEIGLVSEKHGYGGSIDAVGHLDGQLTLLDWKTGTGVYLGQILQVAAYVELWNENFPDNPIKGGAHLVRFDKTNADFSHKFFNDLTKEFDQFLRLLEAYKHEYPIKKRIK